MVSAGTHTGNLLRNLLQTSSSCIAFPGAFNGLVGRAIAAEGFLGCYVSGAGVSSSMGLPDIGISTLNDFTKVIRDVHAGTGLPIIADADTGFGDNIVTARTVQEYARAGASAMHIEDQVFPKRCGHLPGKTVVSCKEFAMKLEAAVQARNNLNFSYLRESKNHKNVNKTEAEGMLIIARTDVRSIEGGGLQEVIDRSKRYVDSGADMIFPEGLHSLKEFEIVQKSLYGYNGINSGKGPFLLANMTEFGVTPIISLDQFTEIGYDVCIFPMTLMRCAMRGVKIGLQTIKEKGSIQTVIDNDQMIDRKETYKWLQYSPQEDWIYQPYTKPPK